MFNNKWYLNKSFLVIGVITVLLLVLVYFLQPKEDQQNPLTINNAYAAYISSFTGGAISTESSLYIKLNKPSFAFERDSVKPPSDFASITPHLPGNWHWIDAQTLVFKPTNTISRNIDYKVSIRLDALFDNIDKEFKTFNYYFKAIPQNMEVVVDGLYTRDNSNADFYILKGKVFFADIVDSTLLRKSVQVEYEGEDLNLNWLPSSDRKHFVFTTSAIVRPDISKPLILNYSGSLFGAETNGTFRWDVPANGAFTVIEARPKLESSNAIQVLFSDPILTNQSLDGLVEVADVSDLNFEINLNELIIYTNENATGNKLLRLFAGIKGVDGKKLEKNYQKTIQLSSLLPSVEFINSGNIVPDINNAVVSFKAIGLKAVDAIIYQIFESNVPAFFQNNSINGENELRRVARPIAFKTIEFAQFGITKLDRFNTYHLDLKDVVKAEPGAIYRVELKFYKQHLTSYCEGQLPPLHQTPDWSNWDEPNIWYYDDSGYEWDDDYDWRQRNNPCNRAFYSEQRFATKNLLFTNIGLLAKRGVDGGFKTFVTDIKTSKPIAGAKISLLDFQLQKLVQGTTNNDGLFDWQSNRKPFLVVCNVGQDKAYLKVDASKSLEISHFDVGGEQIQKGLKGYLFGERGVWRPGDSLYLHLVLEDKQKTLPNGHPIVFELRNPKNIIIGKQVSNFNGNKIYAFLTKTPINAETGNYRLIAKIGGATFEKVIKIETIKPNRLQIQLNVPEKITSPYLKLPLNVKWLHGAEASGLKVVYEQKIMRDNLQFDSFKEYQFNDLSKQFSIKDEPLFEGFLNANGNVELAGNLPKGSELPAALKLLFTGRVFEKGGDFSIDAVTTQYLPYNQYVGLQVPKPKSGYMLANGKTHNVSLIMVNPKGELKKSNQKVKAGLYKLSWAWWWERVGQGDIYINSDYDKPVIEKEIYLENGKANFPIQIDYPNWGRYLLRITDPVSGHTSSEIIFFEWPSWAEGSIDGLPESESVLKIGLNKNKIDVGNEAVLNIPAMPGAKALITIENGKGVLQSTWVEAKGAQITHKIKANPDFSPNVFISVSLIQPFLNKENDLPLRQYGIIRLQVVDKNSHLEPIIDATDTWEPQKVANFSVSEKNGRELDYALFVVDEGLLGITRFKTPNAWNSMNAQEALGVQTWDNYNQIMGSFNGIIDRLISIGGDEGLQPITDEANKRFTPFVKYLGIFNLQKGKKATHQINLPEYNGKLRVMAVAAFENAYGMAEKSVIVKQDFMISASLPRVVGPKEFIRIPVQLFADKANVNNATIQLSINNNLIKAKEQVTINMTGQKQSLGYIEAEVGNKLGMSELTITAKAGNKVASTTIPLIIRTPNQVEHRVNSHKIDPGENLTLPVGYFGLIGSNKATLQLSSIKPINIRSRISELLSYPHGCLEQTISQGFPQIYLPKITELTGQQEANLTNNILGVMQKLENLQLTDGGFSYWAGLSEHNDYATIYAYHFLIEAQKQGFSVPLNMLNSAKQFLSRQSRLWQQRLGHNHLNYIQAYRLRVLAASGHPELGAMNKMRELKQLSAIALHELALAYHLVGQTEAAIQLLDNATFEIAEYRETGNTFGSTIRDKAIIAEILIKTGKTKLALPLIDELTNTLNNNKWLSTQETAVLLRVLLPFSQKSENKNMMATVKYDKEEIKINQTKGDRVIDLNPNTKLIDVSNVGDEAIFLVLTTSGIPEASLEKAQANHVGIQVSYKNNSGIEVDPKNVKIGTELWIETKIQNFGSRGFLNELALTQVFPSGWEIINERLQLSSAQVVPQSTLFDYQDIRDDRVLTYFSLAANSTKVFKTRVIATYTGKFYLPAVKVSAMYDASISAQTIGNWVNVVQIE